MKQEKTELAKHIRLCKEAAKEALMKVTISSVDDIRSLDDRWANHVSDCELMGTMETCEHPNNEQERCKPEYCPFTS